MKNQQFKYTNMMIIAIMLAISGALVVFGFVFRVASGGRDRIDPQFKVVATINPLGDIVSNVAGEIGEVVTILPSGESPYGYELSQDQIADMAQVDMVFAVGHGVDDWVFEAAIEAGVDVVVIVDGSIQMMNYEDDPGGSREDSYYWLSIPNGLLISRNVKEHLQKQYPEFADIFEEYHNQYATKLTKTDIELRQKIDLSQVNRIETTGAPWLYFERDYGLKFRGNSSSETAMELDPFGKSDETSYLELMKYNVGLMTNE